MKGILTMILTVLMSASVFADISEDCKKEMDTALSATKEARSQFLTAVGNHEWVRDPIIFEWKYDSRNAEHAAQRCSLLRIFEAQDSLLFRLGFTSREAVNKALEDTYNEAIRYYEKEYDKK